MCILCQTKLQFIYMQHPHTHTQRQIWTCNMWQQQHCGTCGTVHCALQPNWFVCKSVGNKSNAAAKVQNYFLFCALPLKDRERERDREVERQGEWERERVRPTAEPIAQSVQTVACLSFASHFSPFILAAAAAADAVAVADNCIRRCGKLPVACRTANLPGCPQRRRSFI